MKSSTYAKWMFAIGAVTVMVSIGGVVAAEQHDFSHSTAVMWAVSVAVLRIVFLFVFVAWLTRFVKE